MPDCKTTVQSGNNGCSRQPTQGGGGMGRMPGPPNFNNLVTKYGKSSAGFCEHRHKTAKLQFETRGCIAYRFPKVVRCHNGSRGIRTNNKDQAGLKYFQQVPGHSPHSPWVSAKVVSP